MCISIDSTYIPSSFVKDNLKRVEDIGHGEAKLYLRGYRCKDEYLDFFNNYSVRNTYCFEKQNLLHYMNTPLIIAQYTDFSYLYKNINLLTIVYGIC